LLPLAAAKALIDHWTGWLAPLVDSIAGAIFHGHATHEEMAFVEAMLYCWFVAIPIMIGLSVVGTAKLDVRNPGPLQNVLEASVAALTSFVKGLVGEHHYKDFVPYIGSVFIYIFVLNMVGLIPGMQAATSTVNTTAALAVCTFFYTHYAGFGYAGLGYLKHFAGEPLWLAPLMIPIHFIGELARPLSLTLRLYGNIGGEEKAVAIFISLGLLTGAYLPLQLPLTALGIFTSFVQALIFALLSSVYIGGALPHEHHDSHGHEEMHGHGHPHPLTHGHEVKNQPAHA
jgi:F-type H+-transporting ATPase subunit a